MYTSEVFVDFHLIPEGPVARLRVKPSAPTDELQAKLDGTVKNSVSRTLTNIGKDPFQGDVRHKQEFLGHDGHKSHYRDIPGEYLDPVERSVLTVIVTILAGSFSVKVTSDDRLSPLVAPVEDAEVRHLLGINLSREFLSLGNLSTMAPARTKTETTIFQIILPYPLQAFSERAGKLVPVI